MDFDRLRVHIGRSLPCPNERALRSQELIEAVEAHLAETRFQSLLPTGELFLSEIRDYYKGIAQKQDDLLEITGVSCEDVDRVTWNRCRVTKTQLALALERILAQYTAAFVEPGEAVGAMGAQSISEPGTQMTLKVRQMIPRGDWRLFPASSYSLVLPFASDVPFRRRVFNECHSWRTSSQGDHQCIKANLHPNYYGEVRTG